VCEVRDEVLKQGSYVVVSPIGSIDNGGMPARAVLDASQIDGGPIDRDAVGDTQVSPGRRTATESTVSQVDGTAEEA